MIKRDVITNTLGKSFADKMDAPVLEVSHSLRFTRRDLVEQLGCANFAAAARLETVLKKLKIVTALQLSRMDPFSLLRIRGVGEATVFVAMCLLASRNYDVEQWWGWTQTNVVKFHTYKQQAERRARKRKQEVA